MKKLEKIERVEPPKRRKVALEFDFRPAPRSGEDVAKLEGVKKAYGERSIYDGLDLLIRRRERWCVMGVNGAGKSTLLKLIAGQTEADDGGVSVGASVKLGYFAQHAMELLDADATVLETLQATFPLATIGSMQALAGAFGFSGDDVDKPCRVLSGGEKARLVLAKMLYDPPNFLVLDEPTNHLDMATKEMLVKALAGFEGTMLFVSHDRHFLARAVEPRPRARGGRGARLRRRVHGVRGAERARGAGGWLDRASSELNGAPRCQIVERAPQVVPRSRVHRVRDLHRELAVLCVERAAQDPLHIDDVLIPIPELPRRRDRRVELHRDERAAPHDRDLVPEYRRRLARLRRSPERRVRLPYNEVRDGVVGEPSSCLDLPSPR